MRKLPRFGLKANVLATAVLAFSGHSAHAASVTLDTLITGNGSFPDGGYLTATLEDFAVNTVRLTLDATHLASGRIKSWFLNSTKNPENFSFYFQPLSSIGVFNTALDSITADKNCCAPVPGKSGRFDIEIDFNTSGRLALNRFDHGDIAVFNIVGHGLTASDFMTTSSGGNPGKFLQAAHIVGTTNGDGVKVGAVEPPTPAPVPAPGAIWLLGSALLAGLNLFGRKQPRV